MKRIIEASTEGIDVDTEVFFGFNHNILYGVVRKRRQGGGGALIDAAPPSRLF
jgi:hypothetical protein